MKRLFLLFGIAAYTSASGQQKDIFDIQKHLQKKKAEAYKKNIGKPILLSLSVPLPPQNFSYKLPNGDVVSYGNGRIPCIKTDLRKFSTMPNKEYTCTPYQLTSPLLKQPGQIPNVLNRHILN
jgi:hypothetical protein